VLVDDSTKQEAAERLCTQISWFCHVEGKSGFRLRFDEDIVESRKELQKHLRGLCPSCVGVSSHDSEYEQLIQYADFLAGAVKLKIDLGLGIRDPNLKILVESDDPGSKEQMELSFYLFATLRYCLWGCISDYGDGINTYDPRKSVIGRGVVIHSSTSQDVMDRAMSFIDGDYMGVSTERPSLINDRLPPMHYSKPGAHVKAVANDMMETPIYGLTEAAQYLRVPYNTLRYWLLGGRSVPPLISPVEPARLSFSNLLECYTLSSMRAIYDVRIPKVRRALGTLAKYVNHKHPLIEQVFQTNRRDLFIEHLGEIINLSKGGQLEIRGMMDLYLERVECDPKGFRKLYPFVMQPKRDEPKLILINPAVGFGKPVIAGTGISTAVVVSRFNARESIGDLASEYGVTPQQIEEAIRWEQRTAPVAA